MFAGDLDEVHARAQSSGVTDVLVVGTDLNSSARAIEICRSVDGWRAAVGIHPHECAYFDTSTLEELQVLAEDVQVCAIGEIGLDFYRDNQSAELQEYVFRSQCRLASAMSLPVVVHQRESMILVEQVLATELGSAGGVMHSFTGDMDAARRFLNLGLHVSISGIVTFKNADAVGAMAAVIPDDRLMIETDSPYLAPVPKRGGRNEPSYLVHTAEEVARRRGVSVSSLQVTTLQNARGLFR